MILKPVHFPGLLAIFFQLDFLSRELYNLADGRLGNQEAKVAGWGKN